MSRIAPPGTSSSFPRRRTHILRTAEFGVQVSYTAIPVSLEAVAQIGRLRYLLSQSVKEALYVTPPTGVGHTVSAPSSEAPTSQAFGMTGP